MKKKFLQFTNHEKELLRPAIEGRFKTTEILFNGDSGDKSLRSYTIRLSKLREEIEGDLSFLNLSDMALLEGIIREYILSPNREKIYHYFSQPNVERIYLSTETEKEIDDLNSILILLNKLLSEKKKYKLIEDFRFLKAKILPLYGHEVYFSIGPHNNIYKIGLPINSTELISLPLEYNTGIEKSELEKIMLPPFTSSFLAKGSVREVIYIIEELAEKTQLFSRQTFVKELLNETLLEK